MRRREFLAGLGGVAAACPVAARAQQAKKLSTIGFLGATTAAAARPWVEALERRLRELGWVENRTVAIEYRWADGRADRYPEIAAELVRMKVDIIVTFNTPAIAAAKQATSTIPIVFALGANPVGTGLVASLARPGGNVTGLSTVHRDLIGKRIELLREVSPGLRRLAIMANVGNSGSVVEMREVQAAAQSLGLPTSILEIRKAEDIEAALIGIKGQIDGLYVSSDALINNERVRINNIALGAGLAMMHGAQEFARAGGASVVRAELRGPVSALRRLCRHDSAWSQAGGPSSRTAGPIRSRRESEDRQGARTHCAADIACAHRRGDRVTRRDVG